MVNSVTMYCKGKCKSISNELERSPGISIGMLLKLLTKMSCKYTYDMSKENIIKYMKEDNIEVEIEPASTTNEPVLHNIIFLSTDLFRILEDESNLVCLSIQDATKLGINTPDFVAKVTIRVRNNTEDVIERFNKIINREIPSINCKIVRNRYNPNIVCIPRKSLNNVLVGLGLGGYVDNMKSLLSCIISHNLVFGIYIKVPSEDDIRYIPLINASGVTFPTNPCKVFIIDNATDTGVIPYDLIDWDENISPETASRYECYIDMREY